MMELCKQRETINADFSTVVGSCKQPNVNMPSATSAETRAQLASAFKRSQPAIEARLSALKNGISLDDAERAVPDELRQLAPHEQGAAAAPHQSANAPHLHLTCIMCTCVPGFLSERSIPSQVLVSSRMRTHPHRAGIWGALSIHSQSIRNLSTNLTITAQHNRAGV